MVNFFRLDANIDNVASRPLATGLSYIGIKKNPQHFIAEDSVFSLLFVPVIAGLKGLISSLLRYCSTAQSF